MNRWYVTLLLLLIAGSRGWCAEPRPNVVLFLADDLGWGDLGCYGHPMIQTPHLDAFARQGVRLTQCYAASAVCSPSRAAILTGRTPYRNGVFTWIQEGAELYLRTTERTLPKILREHGYDTCHVGKWHLNGKLNDPSQPQPNDHGYNWWLATQNNAAPSHKNPVNFIRNGRPVGPWEGYSALLVVDEAIRWLREHRDRSKPFFLAVWTHEPHLPIETDPRFQRLYAALSDPDLRQHHGNITQLDHAFGQLMHALDELKLTENTFVFFTSDNGPEGSGEKGRARGSTGGLRGRKRSLYEGGIRVPGLARWPGHISAGRTLDTPVMGTDLFATVLALAGVKPPQDRVLDGVDVLPLLTGKKAEVERPVPMFWRLDMAPHNLHLALRQGDWKLLASRDFQKVELYNLKEDPRETVDRRQQDPTHAAALLEQLRKLNAQVEAEGPDWWKYLNPNGGGPLKKK
ncbi:MAG: sulfatase-like hydrolase/transferase [Gemmataceae bacterium]|nr:sulfatase-like hydrolase/transferase [Gemmataceae bacterium]MCS7270150.1 sulfatase-like hydrolase/transferase [Gemmataceae bacterium]MDW8243943.1 sulfatase-like hydrolase/transferase [Thermogemmata sp.]